MTEADKVKNEASFSSFPGVINWIHSKCYPSRLLADLHRSQKQDLQINIDKARLKIQVLDFKEIEIEVLELVIHHEFFWLERRSSDKFIGKYGSQQGKSSYNSKIKEIESYKSTIRRGYGGKLCLSDFLSQNSDIKVLQLVSDLEKDN